MLDISFCGSFLWLEQWAVCECWTQIVTWYIRPGDHWPLHCTEDRALDQSGLSIQVTWPLLTNQGAVSSLSWPITAQALSLTRSISAVTNVQWHRITFRHISYPIVHKSHIYGVSKWSLNNENTAERRFLNHVVWFSRLMQSKLTSKLRK